MRALTDHIRAYGLPLGLGLLGLVLGLVIAGLPITGILLVAGAAAVVVISFAEPLLGIGVALLVGPLRAWLEIARPGIAPHAGQMVLALALGAWIVRGLLSRDLRLRLPPVLLPLVCFLLVGLVSLWDPVDLWTGTLEFIKWLQVLLVAMVVVDGCAGRPGDRNRGGADPDVESDDAHGRSRVLIAVAVLAASGLSQALIGVWQFGLRGDGVEAFAINERFYRAYGTFQQPNPYAGLLGLVGAVLVGLAVGIFVDSRQWGACPRSAGRRAWVQLAAIAVPAGLILAGLVASWSRGGWMGFGAAMMVLVVLLPRRSWWGLLLIVAVVALGVGLTTTGLLPASIVDRLTGFLSYVRFEDVRGAGITDESFSVVERMAHWQAALSMWRGRFWRGVGLGCYEAAYDAHR
ncbi:MAG: O-antigen ligase family protein, partial [Anaerolineae bacterium]|nr:O-antigen ligase family protein [Anaerolineae bacterium]